MDRFPLNPSSLPIAVIGAGPVGLAAAAHLVARGFTPLVFEAGERVASHLESYRHVRLFSPWQFNVDAEAVRMLKRAGWTSPSPDALPTAGEVIDEYLAPLSRLPAIATALRLGHKVAQVSREGFDKVRTAGRERAAFMVRTVGPAGIEQHRVWGVLDASGTWGTPNPLGANGLPALGEARFSAHVSHGMPDILGRERDRYSGKRTLVLGSGHSAIGSLIALADLAGAAPATRIAWAIRGENLERLFGGGGADGLPARGELGVRLKRLVEQERLEVFTGFHVISLETAVNGIAVAGDDGRRISPLDEIIASTGSRPDWSLARELRIRLDPWLESTEALAPLIDPNVHSCGTVRPHGHRELAQPEARFYAIGAKSYGRAPNFLLATGYEQTRSVVAALAGEFAEADDVRLALPETGVCSTGPVRIPAGQPQPAKTCCAPTCCN